jgi:AraC-like DNA-binding protein
MLPSLKKIDSGINEIFDVLNVCDQHFYPLWHFHPQFEIMLIESSTGTRYVGDNISSFGKGDITILGPDIPHLFRNHPEYYLKNSHRKAKATVIYFNKDILENPIMNLTEFSRIRDVLMLAHRGLRIRENSRANVARAMKQTIKKTGIERFMGFINLLDLIARESDYEVLSSIGYSKKIDKDDVSLINKIFDFLLENFSRNIRLEEIAGIANMSPTTFCRYFKKKTNKTFVSFLNEMRIGYACKLLIENAGMNITQICFEAGFNNLTNFNIQFKKIKGISPQGFRIKYTTLLN